MATGHFSKIIGSLSKKWVPNGLCFKPIIQNKPSSLYSGCRSFHAGKPLMASMRRRIQIGEKSKPLWYTGIQPGTPEFNEKLNPVINWWKKTNTEKLASYIEYDLNNGGQVREGILKCFLFKSHTPKHLHLVYRGLSWIQARWKGQFGPTWANQIVNAAYRARSPAMALRILDCPWIRIWPSVGSNALLIKLVAELSEEKLYKSPQFRDFTPRYNLDEDPENDFVDPSKPQVDTSSQRRGGRHQVEEEEKPEEKIDLGPSDVSVLFQRVMNYINHPATGNKPIPRHFIHQAEYHATVGDISKTREMLQLAKNTPAEIIPEWKIERKLPLPDLSTDHILPTAYLAAGEYQNALDTIAKESPNSKDVRVKRVQIASLLALGQDDAALQIIKDSENVNQPLLAQTHLGQTDRIAKIREFYTKLEADGIQVQDSFKEYLAKLDKPTEAEASTKKK